ncbi:IS481-like element ISRm20 family transposase [Sinorhizobium meliloti]|nr:IS481-like element ISRm20 family transposase [Sinorhizobium meliloti]WQP28846.1 IS481-like element ISRm20 family transposase [Sinorhizobium meliloti]
MPWREVSTMGERREFVRLALEEGVNRRELCRRFGISPDTGYKWLVRWEAGDRELADRSRRPHISPMRCNEAVETEVLGVRDAHRAWGARKIVGYLERQGTHPPAVSTVHAILKRHDRIVAPPGGAPALQRFEKEAPNQLWQMDFKGWVQLADATLCHPLTVIDDHSRFVPCLMACADQRGATVRGHLERTFRRYGLPDAMFVDNGAPWGDPSGEGWTGLGVWLLKLGVALLHSRPYHPQSRGKNERFHRTLKAEVFAFDRFRDLAAVQRAFDAWRELYNFERPHGALDHDVPASRYHPSPRAMPDRLPEPVYDEGEIVRKVSATKAYVSFKGRLWKVPKAFCGERLAIRPLDRDGHYGAFFGAHHIATINLTNKQSVSHLPEQVSAMSPG